MQTRLAELRRAKGLTAEQLAVKAGLTSRTVEYIEAGREGTRLKTLSLLADALDVPLTELLKESA